MDDELIALFKAHPNVPVMPGFWTPRNEIYGARPYWLDDPLLAETFTQAEIKALENPKTPRDAPQTWASGPVPRSMQRLKAAGVRFVLGTDMGGGFSREHDPTPAYFGWSSHIEMESMVKAGLTPSEVITAATRNSAQFLGLDQLGHGGLWQERRLPCARRESAGQHRQHAPDLARVPAGRGSRPRGAENTVEGRVCSRNASADNRLTSSLMATSDHANTTVSRRRFLAACAALDAVELSR